MSAERLAQPFPPEVLRQREKGGRTFTYAPGAEVIARLNGVLGVAAWSFEVVDWRLVENQAVVHGRLRLMDAVYEQFGGQEVKRYSENHKTAAGRYMDLGDDLKGAATDALKKCAQMLGVGLDLARTEEALLYERVERAHEAAEAATTADEAERGADATTGADVGQLVATLQGEWQALPEVGRKAMAQWRKQRRLEGKLPEWQPGELLAALAAVRRLAAELPNV